MAKAKVKAVPKIDDGTITRNKETTKVTPKGGETDKTRDFTAVFGSDAHAAADHWVGEGSIKEISREESNAGGDAVRVTGTYK